MTALTYLCLLILNGFGIFPGDTVDYRADGVDLITIDGDHVATSLVLEGNDVVVGRAVLLVVGNSTLVVDGEYESTS